jgi:hypothetical protein
MDLYPPSELTSHTRQWVEPAHFPAGLFVRSNGWWCRHRGGVGQVDVDFEDLTRMVIDDRKNVLVHWRVGARYGTDGRQSRDVRPSGDGRPRWMSYSMGRSE